MLGQCAASQMLFSNGETITLSCYKYCLIIDE